MRRGDAGPRSVLNLWNGTVRSNLALVKLSAETGEVCLRPTLYNGSSITLIADTVGWTPGGPARGPVPPPPTPPAPGPGGKFPTLPVGAALPSDGECAARVRSTPEIRAVNVPYNNTTRDEPARRMPRVTGNFTGTTDEILQWAACKWGIDEDIVRAQIAKESWWTMDAVGDNGESFGLGQVRVPYHGVGVRERQRQALVGLQRRLHVLRWRSCYEGNETWLNSSSTAADYAAGDIWGCVGLWFSGRWYARPPTTSPRSRTTSTTASGRRHRSSTTRVERLRHVNAM